MPKYNVQAGTIAATPTGLRADVVFVKDDTTRSGVVTVTVPTFDVDEFVDVLRAMARIYQTQNRTDLRPAFRINLQPGVDVDA